VWSRRVTQEHRIAYRIAANRIDFLQEYMVFEDEGHGFTKTADSLKALRATAEWFERFLAC
jgi:dipeptidyl aminopeptidase/acylaminoacyl peptidase